LSVLTKEIAENSTLWREEGEFLCPIPDTGEKTVRVLMIRIPELVRANRLKVDKLPGVVLVNRDRIRTSW
jgi:hypothetical protein